jgi:hypothetical protein
MVGVERKMAKVHVSRDAKAYVDKVSEVALGCWESLSFYRQCRVEKEPTVLRQEVSPLAGSCVLRICQSSHWLLRGAYSETTSARRGWVPSKMLMMKSEVALSAWAQG